MSFSTPSTVVAYEYPLSPQSESTYAFTPEPEPGTIFFARLLPHNLAAQQLFDLMSVDADYEQYSPHLHKGFYRIGLDHDRALHRNGWVIGTGCHDSPNTDVDIQLYPQTHFQSSKGYREYIAERHASILIHPISGVLMIKNNTSKPITCTGYDESGNMTTNTYTICKDDKGYNSTYVLHRRVTRLNFGPLSFNLKIEDFDYTAFINLRNLCVSVDTQSLPLQVINPFALLDSTEQLDPGEVAIIAEVSGSLSGGISLITGEPYVIKHSTITPNHPGRQMECKLMSTFSKQQQLYLLPTHYTPPQQLEKQYTAIYTMDMALFSFQCYFTKYPKAIPIPVFLNYSRQILRGLHFLHSEGIVHGSISPNTLLLLSDSQALPVEKSLIMHAAICPIMKSTPGNTDPSRPFIAPCPKGGNRYSKEADIWALGATWLWCLDLYDNVSTNTDDRAFNTMVMLNDSLMQAEDRQILMLLEMVKDMITNDPAKRPTSEELLKNSLWTTIKDDYNMPISQLRKRRADGDVLTRERRHISV